MIVYEFEYVNWKEVADSQRKFQDTDCPRWNTEASKPECNGLASSPPIWHGVAPCSPIMCRWKCTQHLNRICLSNYYRMMRKRAGTVDWSAGYSATESEGDSDGARFINQWPNQSNQSSCYQSVLCHLRNRVISQRIIVCVFTSSLSTSNNHLLNVSNSSRNNQKHQ